MIYKKGNNLNELTSQLFPSNPRDRDVLPSKGRKEITVHVGGNM